MSMSWQVILWSKGENSTQTQVQRELETENLTNIRNQRVSSSRFEETYNFSDMIKNFTIFC